MKGFVKVWIAIILIALISFFMIDVFTGRFGDSIIDA